METMFQKILDTVKVVGPVQQGADALAQAHNRLPRTFIGDTMLAKGDIVTIPTIDGSVAADIEQWLDAPIVKGGDPVFGPLAKVVSTTEAGDKRERAQRLYIGQFLKELRNRNTNAYQRNRLLDKSGNPITFDDCVDQFDQWSKLAGRTFKVIDIETVPTQKRHRKTMVLYDADGTLTHFQEI